MKKNANSSTSMPQMGLRERKAIKTRERITHVAMQLFLERGFSSVTLAEIAEAADVAPRTLANYFGSKEALVYAWQDAGCECLVQMIAEQPETEDAFSATSRAMQMMIQEIPHKEALQLAQMIEETPVLKARDHLKTDLLERRVAEVLCARDATLSIVNARLIAMIVLGTYRVTRDIWLENGGNTDPARDIETALVQLQDRVAVSIVNAGKLSRLSSKEK